MDYSDIIKELGNMKDKYHTDLGTLNLHKKQFAENESLLESLKGKQEHHAMMKELLERASKEARENGKEILSQTATSSLQMVMGDNLSVDIQLDSARGVPVADVLVKAQYPNEVVETDPAQEDGGGRADIVSLATFASVNLLVGDNNKAGFFLDEPTKYVSKEPSENTAHLIRELVDYTGRQTFLVSHEDTYMPLVSDSVFRMELDENGTTIAEKID